LSPIVAACCATQQFTEGDLSELGSACVSGSNLAHQEGTKVSVEDTLRDCISHQCCFCDLEDGGCLSSAGSTGLLRELPILAIAAWHV
jgi:hypothetical protein